MGGQGDWGQGAWGGVFSKPGLVFCVDLELDLDLDLDFDEEGKCGGMEMWIGVF